MDQNEAHICGITSKRHRIYGLLKTHNDEKVSKNQEIATLEVYTENALVVRSAGGSEVDLHVSAKQSRILLQTLSIDKHVVQGRCYSI